MLQESKIENNDNADKDLEDQQKPALGQKIRLAGLVNQLRTLLHRGVDGQILESLIDDETEDQTQCGNNQTGGQQGGAADATHKRSPVQVGQHEVDFPTAMLGGHTLRRRECGNSHSNSQQHQAQENCRTPE